MVPIYIVSFTFKPECNGVSHVALRQAEYFKTYGYEVHIVTNKKDRLDKDFIYHEFDVTGSPLLYNFYRGEVRTYIKFLSSLKNCIVVFHCWQIWSTDLSVLSGILNKNDVKVVMFSHGIGVNTKHTLRDLINVMLFLPYRMVVRYILNKADLLCFLSNSGDNDRFLDRLWVNSSQKLHNKSITIPNGCDNKINSRPIDFKLDLGIELNRNYCLYISNFQNGKNQLEAIKIIQNYNDKCANQSEKLTVILVGSYDSHYLESLKEYIAKHSISDFVKIYVNIDQSRIDYLYSICLFSIFTSINECMPLVVLESIERGLPVLSSNVGNVKDIDGVVIYKDINDAVDIIKNLFDVPYSNNLRSLAERYVHNNAWSIILNKLHEAINELTDSCEYE